MRILPAVGIKVGCPGEFSQDTHRTYKYEVSYIGIGSIFGKIQCVRKISFLALFLMYSGCQVDYRVKLFPFRWVDKIIIRPLQCGVDETSFIKMPHKVGSDKAARSCYGYFMH